MKLVLNFYDWRLAGEIEKNFRASLDSNSALQILQETYGLHTLKAACEKKVAEEFETCSQHPDFGKLSSGQLARILKREDLVVSREEEVLKALFSWLKVSKDRNASLAMLLQLVDFHSISVENLLRLGRASNLSGPACDDLHREVNEALCQRRSQSSEDFRPRRRCLQLWSQDWGALGRKVLDVHWKHMRWHEGTIYGMDFKGGIQCWTPGDPATHVRQLVGEGTVIGSHKLGSNSDFAIGPAGEIFVADNEHRRLVSFTNGSGRLLVDDVDRKSNTRISCSPNGVLYVLTDEALQKLEGSRLQTVATFPEDLQSWASEMCVTKEEMIYILDMRKLRFLRFDPAESFKPVVVGQLSTERRPGLWAFFVTEGGTIYVPDTAEDMVLVIRPGEADCTEVLACQGGLSPFAVLVHDRSLYISMSDEDSTEGGLFQCAFPAELHFE